MIQSAFVYLSLMGLMIMTGNFQEKSGLNPKRNIPFLYMVIPCLLYAFVFGCRYNVGVDYPNYLSDYRYGFSRELEPGYIFIVQTFKGWGLHFAWFFGFIALLQITFFVSALKDRRLFPWLVLALILGGRWLGWCNGMRQAVAACFFVFSCLFIEKKKPMPFLICVLLAFLFHKSSIILIPFYFIGRVDFFKTKWIPWIVFISALVISKASFFNDYIESSFSVVAEMSGYGESYTVDDALERIEFKKNESTGLGLLISNATTVLLLSFMQQTKKYFNTHEFTIFSNLFLVGLFGATAFKSSIILCRPFGFFTPFREIIMSYVLFYLFNNKQKNNMIWGWILLSLIFMTFIAVVFRGKVNTAEFHFFWEFI